MSLHWVSYYHAIQISTVAVGMISISTYPVITACLEPAIMKEPFKYVDLLLTLLVLFGLSLIVPDFNLSNRVTQGVFWGVVSAVLLSIRNIYSRKMIKHYSGDQLMFYQLLFGFIILTPVLGLYPVTLRVQDWGLLLLLGSVFTALGHSLWLSSLRVINAKTAGLMSCFAPVIGISFAFLLLGEVPEKRTLFGCIIILTGIFLESYWLFRKKASSR
ncbi:MAG: drug/metabolite transporter (DMT)-like permease [Candidatus Marinamargulisbacteria bacterium]|jgi:drug/metabolite transporter (DMT)-like permease